MSTTELATSLVITCFECRRPIPVRTGEQRVDAVMLHYVHKHPEVLVRIDRRQMTYQSP
jgi:hypothetical protein